MDYKVELRITITLRKKCLNLFSKCEEFENPRKLRGFVSVKELHLVLECIEPSESIEWNGLMNKLLNKVGPSKEPLLIDLLDALAVVYENDTKGPLFIELKKEIRLELAENEGQEREQKTYQKLVDATDVSDASPDLRQLAEQWIEAANNNLDELSLRITLAVFNGTSFEVIERAKADLLSSLQELSPKTEVSAGEPVAGQMMRRVLAAGARETEGQPPDWRRVVELDRPELAVEALTYVWQLNRESEWRRKLMDWLTKHAANNPADVRIRTALAVGRLAVKDYRFVRDNLLSQWLRKDHPQYRTAIGMALGVVVREEKMTAEVQNLLYGWTHSGESLEKWAAMRAYIYVGPYCQPASEPILRWREIAESELLAVDVEIEGRIFRLNNPLHMSLADAVVKFFFSVSQLAPEERRRQLEGILEALKSWVAAKDDRIGLGTFMFSTLGHLLGPVSADDQTDNAPVLLEFIQDQPAANGYRTQLAQLFELSMRTGVAIVEARNILCNWLRWVDGQKSNSEVNETRLRILLRDIVTADNSGKVRGKLIASLRSCGRSRTAERLLGAL